MKDVTLSGEVREAQVLTAGKIIVASDARVESGVGRLSYRRNCGRVLGNVLASHCCRLRPTAKLAGDILCRHLQMIRARAGGAGGVD